MQHFFQPTSKWHPFRWFIVIATSCTLLMSYADATGWRFLSFDSGGKIGPSGSSYGSGHGHGGVYYHK